MSSIADDASVRTIDSDIPTEEELPSIEDRKTFLTCLACLLVSSYKYDVIEEEETPQQQQPSEGDVNTNDKDENGETNEDDEEAGGSPSRPRANSNNSDEDDLFLDTQESLLNEVSMFLEFDEAEAVNLHVTNQPPPNGHPSNSSQPQTPQKSVSSESDTTPSRGERWRRRFGRKRSDQSSNSVNTTPNSMDGSENNGRGRSFHSASSFGSANGANSNSEQKQRRKRVSKAQKKLQLASKRHYHRRHVVAEQLLQSSCELLLLDPDVSMAVNQQLQPLLADLQSPRIAPASATSKQLTKQTRNIIRKRWPSVGNNTSSNNNKSGSDSDENENDNENENENNDDNNDNGPEEHNGNSSPSKRSPRKTTSSDSTLVEDPRIKQLQQQYLKQNEWMTEYDTELADHLPGLSPGAGYRCVCWLLFQHLIGGSKHGYDARVRYAFKTLAVAVLIQDIERTLNFSGEKEEYVEWKEKNYTTWVSFATRKFEQVENAMAQRLLKLAQTAQNEGDNNTNNPYEADASQTPCLEELEEEAGDDVKVVTVTENKKKIVGARKHLVRGLKIGGVGVVAGTLLAVTGGMAAPAIAGALTFLGMGAVAGTFLTLASTHAVIHLFGVAGGSLAAYKMRRRTAGLTEFKFVESAVTAARQQEDDDSDASNNHQDDLLPEEVAQMQQQQSKSPRLARWREKAKAFKERRSNHKKSQYNPDAPPKHGELSRTICVSGWLTDKCDFQRPWGLTPTRPPATKLEKLQRFYRIYNPDLLPVCNNLLKRWKKEESTFWELLEDKYGCNPDTLFPLRYGPMHDAALTETEISVLDKLIVEIGEARGKKNLEKHADLPEHVQHTIVDDSNIVTDPQEEENIHADDASVAGSVGSILVPDPEDQQQEKEESDTSHRFQRQCYASVFEQVAPSANIEKLIPPDHLVTVWDYSSRYGGEIYSLHWETHMLLKLCQCFRELAMTATASAGQQALKFMVANTLALAASVPIYIMQYLGSIDETWTVVVSRADEAGKELARSLLVNNSGNRPVTLCGYSFGARVIFSCLKQLVVYQQQWEEYHEEKNTRAINFAQHDEEGKRKNRREKKKLLHELEFDREPASIVEDVILMGAPMYLSLSSWKACRQIVAGRFVNVYSRTDKILSLMFKYKQMSVESFKPVCGNCTVAVPGVENVDISDLVNNHQEYTLKVGDILKRVRHGQPIRSSSNALDEVALIAEAEALAKEQKQLKNSPKEEAPSTPDRVQSDGSQSSHDDSEETP